MYTFIFSSHSLAASRPIRSRNALIFGMSAFVSLECGRIYVSEEALVFSFLEGVGRHGGRMLEDMDNGRFEVESFVVYSEC
jgi:hypothetical protein